MAAPPYRLERLGIVMTPDPDDPREAWGVLNPATARRDGEVFLFPRLVADGNVSRVGRARVLFDAQRVPVGVERLGVVLEPEEAWERHEGAGGVEDPRITYLPRLARWFMTYSAFGPFGPHVALAVSEDLEHWERLGPISFAYQPGSRTDLNMYPNKDALLFPEPVTDPEGGAAYAILHRPMWNLAWVLPGAGEPLPTGLTDARPGIWVSFAAASAVEDDVRALTRFEHHRLVALPERDWEAIKIGGGTPPIRVDEGWLVVHHGVAGEQAPGFGLQSKLRYSAGALILDPSDVTRVVARSPEPLLEPKHPDELAGIVPNVVFPTAIEPLDEGATSEHHVYYGMADSRIGVARLRRTDPGA